MGLEVGNILEGKVTGITKFGAFVSLPGNRSGLVHISEIAYSYVNDIHDHLTEGQTVTVKIIGIDENNRINLSIKQAAPPPPRPERRPQANRSGGAGGGPRPRSEDAPRRSSRPPAGGYMTEATVPKGPASFEDQLKQFMASSDSKLSELHMNEKRSSRRGGGRK